MKRVLRRASRLAWWTLTLQLPRRVRAWRNAAGEHRPYDEWIRAYDSLEGEDLDAARGLAGSLRRRPLVSILMPVYNPPEPFLREALESIRSQTYDQWELCVADDASTAGYVRPLLETFAGRDPRIRIAFRETNGGISAASNTALGMATGELTGLVDHDDVLRPHALLLVVRAFDERPELGFVYSDEDKIDQRGRRSAHYFKPDWNPALLLSQNYLSHFSVFRTDLARAAGGFRSDFDGSQDWDLFLRVTRELTATQIGHVPHVLYHWRAHQGSAAATVDAKPSAVEAGRRAVADHLDELGVPAAVSTVRGDHQSVRYEVSNDPRVTAIVPTAGRADLVGRIVAGLTERTSYPGLDVALVASERDRTESLEELARDRGVHLLSYADRSTSSAWVINWAARQANAELLVLLSDHVEVIAEDWLEIMVGHAIRDGVGAVGALLIDRDETIRHAGIMVGAGPHEIADHLYRGRLPWSGGYANRLNLNQDLSAVTGACMVVRRDAFEAVGGLDETLPLAYNDVDLCLRLRKAGWRVVFTPDATLCQHETAPLASHHGKAAEEESLEIETMRARWDSVLVADPMHNPNLARDAAHPEQLAFPPRVSYPFRVR